MIRRFGWQLIIRHELAALGPWGGLRAARMHNCALLELEGDARGLTEWWELLIEVRRAEERLAARL